MNKKELIEKINAIPWDEGLVVDTLKINRAGLIQLIEQFDEPKEKVALPRPVVNWISCVRGRNKTLYYALDHSPEEVNLWFCEDEANHQNIFARAWLDGYEVEKEKRYRVKAKGVCFNSCLIFEKINKTWIFSSIYETDHQRGNHTRKELEEAGLGWVFDCPGIEIEEVEE